jgi:hypothetical protein
MKLVSPDSLQGAEKLVFENIKSWFPPGAVCVNVMLGQDPWDLRPLLLINGKVALYRFSRPLGIDALNQLAAEMQGFVVIPGWELKVERKSGQERLLMTRPFFQKTLKDSLESMPRGSRRHEMVASLINIVRELERRRLVHGHISPSNIAEAEGQLVLLDPRLGSLHHSNDSYLAPESVSGEEPKSSVDLFGLGCVIDEIMGDDATHQQRQVIDRLRLPSPRQRPAIDEVEREFIRSLPAQSRDNLRVGRLINKQKRESSDEPATSGGSRSAQTRQPREMSTLTRYATIGLITLAISVFVVKNRAPRTYFDLFGSFPLLVSQHNQDYELAWASNEKAQMKAVSRAAVLDHDPAAQNTIIEDTLGGENRQGVNGQLIRVALNKSWAEDLSSTDKLAAITLGVQQILPDGIKELPPIENLHPGVILAIAGQTQPTKANKDLRALAIDRLIELPAPVGKVFEQLKATGTKSLGDPETIALAGMVSGNPPAATVDAYIGSDTSTPLALSRLAIVVPLLAANEGMATQLLGTLRDRGGELGQVLSWFDIDALGLWGKAKNSDKLVLLLAELPATPLTLQHYSDLLTFPLAPVRVQSAKKIAAGLVKGEPEQLFMVLAGEQNRLTRDQTVALLSALSLDPAKRIPFIASWFELKPSSDMVVLVLLARSNKDPSDLFNLEAARYLRKAQWNASTEMLQIMARHQEPLARSLAYAKLSTRDPAQKAILQKRVSEETDQGLLRALTTKLSPPPPPPIELAPAAPLAEASPPSIQMP